MQIKRAGLLSIAFFVFILTSCNVSKKAVQSWAVIKGIKFLGGFDIPYNLNFNNTTVGGLSGIDYDAIHKQYYLISDDRSERNPARFYTAAIDISSNGIKSMHFIAAKNMLQADGTVYPNNKKDPFNTPDPEGIRYNPVTKQLLWSSEGERMLGAVDTVLEDPSLSVISKAGKFIKNIPLPPNLKMQATENGPRQNGVLEGMTYADNYKTLFINVEEPLFEDGPRADLTDNNAFIRFYKFDVGSYKNIAQYAYKLEPVAHIPNPVNAFKVNGVPDILSIGDNKLLVIERSFSTGRLACTIKIFIADLRDATDVRFMQLKNNGSFIPASKKLLLNMDNLGIYIDNIEGVSFGPRLPNGHKTLLFIADNNFSIAEKSQLLLFEIEE